MAISNSFFGLRRGSTKSMTFQVLNGQQITKDRVLGGKNPRSDAQMTQRTQFLSAVRFYERSQRNFFRFAFESRKQTESEYNAFMRLNAKIGPYVTKAQGDAVGFPMVAPWMIAQGSLQSIPQSIVTDPDLGDQIGTLLVREFVGVAPSTIGELSELLRSANPSILEGDVITIAVIRGSEDGDGFVNNFDAVDIVNVNDWFLDQFIVDSADTREVGEVLTSATTTILDGNLYLVGMPGDATKVYGGAIVLSRNTPSGLKVATTSIHLNELANSAYDAMRSNTHREQVLAWWGAQAQAILQGSLATRAEQPTPPGPTPFIPIEGRLTAGSTSASFASPFATPIAFGDGSLVSLVMIDNSGAVPLRVVETLSYSGGAMTGESQTDVNLGTMTLTQGVSADGKLVFSLTNTQSYNKELIVRFGVIVAGKIEYNDTYTLPERKVVDEISDLYFSPLVLGVPDLTEFVDGDEVSIAVKSAAASAVIKCNQYEEAGDNGVLKGDGSAFGVGEVTATMEEANSLQVTSNTTKGVEYEVALVSIKRNGIIYPIANN